MSVFEDVPSEIAILAPSSWGLAWPANSLRLPLVSFLPTNGSHAYARFPSSAALCACPRGAQRAGFFGFCVLVQFFRWGLGRSRRPPGTTSTSTKNLPKTAKITQDDLQDASKTAKMSSKTAKMASRCLQDGLRCTQDGPRWPQDGSISFKRRPQRPPTRPKRAPRGPPRRPP